MATNEKYQDLATCMSEEDNFALVINYSKSLSSEKLIAQIVKDDVSSEETPDGLSYYPWRIHNKYYDARIKFILASSAEINLTTFKIRSSAVLIVCDLIQSSLDAFKDLLSRLEASVVLLIGSKTDGNMAITTEILNLSVKHSFEFVDLNEEIDLEDDFPDTVGVARIIQALEANEWPHLQLRDMCDKDDGKDKEVVRDSNNSLLAENSSLYELVASDLETVFLDNDNSFDTLFSQMKLMKEKAGNLPHSERKAYAEQVAMAFWKAIGGDDDEVEDD